MQETKGRGGRPLWFVMLVMLSVLPIMVWMYAFQKMNGMVDGVNKFVLDFFPLYMGCVLVMAYYLYPTRAEVSKVLVAVAWLSYVAIGLMAVTM